MRLRRMMPILRREINRTAEKLSIPPPAIDSGHGGWRTVGRPSLPGGSAMARQFIAKSLASDGVDRAYVVARNGAPGLSLEDWRDYAGGLIRRGPVSSGVLTVENLAGTVQGLCSYRIDPSPGHGAICSVEFLVALDLLNSETVT